MDIEKNLYVSYAQSFINEATQCLEKLSEIPFDAWTEQDFSQYTYANNILNEIEKYKDAM